MKVFKILAKAILVIPMLYTIIGFFVGWDIGPIFPYVPGIPTVVYMLLMAAFDCGGFFFDLLTILTPVIFIIGACLLGKAKRISSVIVYPILLLSIVLSFPLFDTFSLIASIIYFILALLVNCLRE